MLLTIKMLTTNRVIQIAIGSPRQSSDAKATRSKHAPNLESPLSELNMRHNCKKMFLLIELIQFVKKTVTD